MKVLTWPAALASVVLTCGLAVAPVQAAPTVTAPTTASTSATAAVADGDLSPERTHALLRQMRALLPSDFEARLARVNERLGIPESAADLVARRAIDPTAHECSGTPLREWLESTTTDWTSDEWDAVTLGGLTIFPTYDALLFGSNATPQVYGVDGEFSTDLRHTLRDLKRFWDIDGSTIHMAPMHGDMMLDRARVERLLMVLFGGWADEAWAKQYSALVFEFVNQPKFDYGNHPMFTFNAFAASWHGQEAYPGSGVLPDIIVMGDGVLQGYAALGLADVGPKAILAHEYGHHLQLRKNLFNSPLEGAEAARRTELMADAFAAYYLSHARGATMQWKRVQQFMRTFYNVGDCQFANPQHHGTPNQRMRAARWGYEVADAARPQSRILPSLEFARLFDRQLPVLVAPDA